MRFSYFVHVNNNISNHRREDEGKKTIIINCTILSNRALNVNKNMALTLEILDDATIEEDKLGENQYICRKSVSQGISSIEEFHEILFLLLFSNFENQNKQNLNPDFR